MHGNVPTSSPAVPLGPGIPLTPDFPWRKRSAFSTPELLKQFASNVEIDSVYKFSKNYYAANIKLFTFVKKKK